MKVVYLRAKYWVQISQYGSQFCFFDLVSTSTPYNYGTNEKFHTKKKKSRHLILRETNNLSDITSSGKNNA